MPHAPSHHVRTLATATLIASIGVNLDWITLEAGYYFYNFPTLTATDSQELFVKAGFGLPWKIAFETTLYWDFHLSFRIGVRCSLRHQFSNSA
jgi:hypothetical protein